MSAFVQGKEHIDAVICLALEGPKGRPVNPGNAWYSFSYYHNGDRHNVRHEDADAVGAMLTAENARSVQYRYPDSGMDDLPGPVDNGFVTDALMGSYRYPIYGSGPIAIAASPRRLTAVEGLKAINGYEYQSCEHPGWESSAAKAFCDALKDALINALPGYDDADTWSI